MLVPEWKHLDASCGYSNADVIARQFKDLKVMSRKQDRLLEEMACLCTDNGNVWSEPRR